MDAGRHPRLPRSDGSKPAAISRKRVPAASTCVRQVAEQHVEKELPISPAGAIRPAPKAGTRRFVHELMECGSCLLHLIEHRWSVQDEHLQVTLPDDQRHADRGRHPSPKPKSGVPRRHCLNRAALTTTVRARTADSRLPIAIPMIMLISAVLTLLAVLASNANGITIMATVTSPTIQPKNTLGRGVVTVSKCARPVAASANTNAVAA